MNLRADIFIKKLMQFIPNAALVKINFLNNRGVTYEFISIKKDQQAIFVNPFK